jgi:hypothetical protein
LYFPNVQDKEISLRQHAILLGAVDFDLVRHPRGQRTHTRDLARGAMSGSRIRNHIYNTTAIACGVYEQGTARKYYQAAVNAAWPYESLWKHKRSHMLASKLHIPPLRLQIPR